MAQKRSPQTPIESDEHKPFIAEVDDALREERLAALWQKYKVLIIGAVILLFVGVAGKNYYASYQAEAAQKRADAYFSAVEAEDVAGLTGIVDAGSPFAPLAAVAIVSLDPEMGAEAFAKVRDMAKGNPVLADMARYYRALALMGAAPKEAEAELAVLTGGESPLRLSALELQARIFAARGEKASAISFYEEISTTAGAPTSLKQRALQALALLRS